MCATAHFTCGLTLLNATYQKPTLALVGCTPYLVDTHRVVVIAQMR